MTWLLLALLAAAPKTPAPDLVIHAPRASALPPLVSFLAAAGRHSVMLRPDSWQPELFALVAVDPARPESFREAGLDPEGALTLYVVDDARISCAALSDPKRFEQAAGTRLLALGDPWKPKVKGITGAQIEGKPIAGYAISGRRVCSLESPARAEALLTVALALAGAAPPRPPPGVTGSAFALRPGGAFSLGLDGTADRLLANGLLPRLTEPALLPAGPSPYGAMKPSGVLLARARVARASMPRLLMRLESRLAAACASCDRKQMIGWVNAIAATLSGDVAFRVDRVQVAGSLREPSARFFAIKEALVAQVADVDAARALVAQIAQWPNARATDRGYALRVSGGDVELGLSGSQLYFANDAQALANLLAEVPPRAARLEHGALLWADPKRVSRAFGQVSLLDLMSSRELAGIIAFGTELGPLLGHSRAVDLWADRAPSGGHRFALTWTLDPPP